MGGAEGVIGLDIIINGAGKVLSVKAIGKVSDPRIGPLMFYSEEWAKHLRFPAAYAQTRPYRIFMKYKLPESIGISNKVETIVLKKVATPMPRFK
jgi:hypothetical protein